MLDKEIVDRAIKKYTNEDDVTCGLKDALNKLKNDLTLSLFQVEVGVFEENESEPYHEKTVIVASKNESTAGLSASEFAKTVITIMEGETIEMTDIFEYELDI
jgi:hypothetical protein